MGGHASGWARSVLQEQSALQCWRASPPGKVAYKGQIPPVYTFLIAQVSALQVKKSALLYELTTSHVKWAFEACRAFMQAVLIC